jgi:transcription-repair coupling factor (superfamily II helicase)
MTSLPAREQQETRAKIGRAPKRKARTGSPASGTSAGAQAISSSSPIGLIALHVLEQWRRSKQQGLIFVADDERRAEHLGAILSSLEPGCGVMVLPRQDVLAYDEPAPSPEISGRRASVLRRLSLPSKPHLLVATAEALIPRVPPADAWQFATLHIRAGDSIGQNEIEDFLARAGYSLEDRVDAPGSAMLLGQVVEIYPAGALDPVRISVTDGRISAIHSYDQDNKRELAELKQLTLDAVSEFAEIVGQKVDRTAPSHTAQLPARDSVFTYMPSARLLADCRVTSRANNWIQLLEEAGADSSGPTQQPQFLSRTEWERQLSRPGASILPETTDAEQIPNFARAASPSKSLRAFLHQQQKLGMPVVFTAATEADLRTMDRRAGRTSERCSDWHQAMRRRGGGRTSVIVDFDRGFVRSGSKPAVVITATDVMGSRAAHQSPMAAVATAPVQETSNLWLGDVAIHLDRGFSIVNGLETVCAASIPEAEMVRLEFADKEMVLVPVEELREVWRYSSDSVGITLDKADGSSWRKRRTEIEAELTETAARLSELVAERQMRSAPKIVPSAAEYERFAARFPYFPTADQSRAIEDVLKDLALGQPMDRLVCGDVGYGKTEVALRAAAAVVFSGKQVAVAVPTTVLARQHVQTFRKRFAPFGIQIGHLSRFATTAEARALKKAMRDGSVRVVIGTHALASKGVQFADLGLLVIDEEQRFGTADKAKLAKLGEGIHVLTMTATPIPRTLSQVSSGIRSVSTILTPPVRRIPVRTVAQSFDEATVAAALRREHRRRGQSFVVCPKIADIDPMQARLAAIVPDLAVTKVHGKMPIRDIEDAMVNFAEGKTDVLLATNIIESGLDLPRANTMIVWRPEMFGLAQLHQLRGRVGRSGTRAYAYFMSDPETRETESSMARLQVLCEANGPGAGLEISQRDLDLRGGGDPLSERQSGHLKALGPGLYRHLLERAMSSDRGQPNFAQERPQLRLDLSRVFPKQYIQNDAVRLEMYVRIAKCRSEPELEEIEDELEERFGKLPVQSENLIATARLELDCCRLGILQIDAGPDAVAAVLRERPLISKPKMRKTRYPLLWKDGRVIYRRPSAPAERLAAVRELVDVLECCSG